MARDERQRRGPRQTITTPRERSWMKSLPQDRECGYQCHPAVHKAKLEQHPKSQYVDTAASLAYSPAGLDLPRSPAEWVAIRVSARWSVLVHLLW